MIALHRIEEVPEWSLRLALVILRVDTCDIERCPVRGISLGSAAPVLDHRDLARTWRSILDLEWDIELDEFGVCGYRVGQFGNRRITAFVRRRGIEPSLGDELATACLAAVEANIVILDEGIYSALEDEARERALRDPRDWPAVASALALDAAIWTNDNDFLGAGVATWTTDALQRWLERQPQP